jgi:Cu+-exporting ATPase
MDDHVNKSESSHGVDPACGMDVAEDSGYRHTHAGDEYLFCSVHCEKKFAADPSSYLHSAGNLPTAENDAADAACADESCEIDTKIYTCPMHPEIIQDLPGNCPKCGMALEPRSVEVEEDTSELDDMTRRFRVSTVLATLFFCSRWWRISPRAGCRTASP